MMAKSMSELRGKNSTYMKCNNCGMYQMHDFKNACMYCGSMQFTPVYEEYDEGMFHENR